MKQREYIEKAKEHFGNYWNSNFGQDRKMKAEADFIDYNKLDEIVIGIVGGDGIGPYITGGSQEDYRVSTG